jgi:ribonuclease HI
VGRKSEWEWPVQQRPVSWKAWKDAIEYLAPVKQISPTLGEWNKMHHQTMEWYVDSTSNTLYRHTEGVWLRHHTSNASRMRFSSEGVGCDKPESVTHIVETSERPRNIEVTGLKKIYEVGTRECDVPFHYDTVIGYSGRQLQRHVQRLVGDIAALDVSETWDSNEPRDLLVATDGSVVFGVGYHSWVTTTMNEKVILSGGGPDDGEPLLMTSYRSELAGLASALAVLGMLERSGRLNIRSVKCVSDSQSAVRACKRKPKERIFHRTESDYNLLATIMNLQEEWCNGINIHYAWVRGHADSLDRETTRE